MKHLFNHKILHYNIYIVEFLDFQLDSYTNVSY